MKVALTGANGLLGSTFVEVSNSYGHSVQRLERGSIYGHSPHVLAEQLDGVDWILHAAANTNVEQCELDVDSCYRDNLILTEQVSDAARIAGVPLVYVSSTGVYGSQSTTPYAEYHAVHPTTQHHRAKQLGEVAVLARSCENLVVRTGWLFGGEPGNPKNFVVRRIEEARRIKLEGGVMKSNKQQVGCPTATRDVAIRLLALVASGHSGIFNCVNTGTASRFQYVSEILRLSGETVVLEPANPSTFNRLAKVSDNEAATNWRMTQLGFEPMPRWEDSLAEYISSLSGFMHLKGGQA